MGKQLSLIYPELVEDAFKIQETLTISATGTSMLPLIRPGEALVIKRCGPRGIKKGDIVLTRKDTFFVLHRVHRILRDPDHSDLTSFITKGDASTLFDPPSSPSFLVAKVISLKKLAFREQLQRSSASFLMRKLTLAIALLRRYITQAHDSPWYALGLKLRDEFLGPRFSLTGALNRFLPDRLLENVNETKELRSHQLLLPETRFLPVKPSDPLDGIHELWNASVREPQFQTPDQLRHHFFINPLPGETICLACHHGSKVVGVILGYKRVFPTGMQGASIEGIAVHPDFHRKKIATMLLHQIKKEFRKRKIKTLHVCNYTVLFPGLYPSVHQDVIDFFTRQGFVSGEIQDDMIFRREHYTRPKALDRIEDLCRKKTISFVLLERRHLDAFSRYLRTSSPQNAFFYQNIVNPYPLNGEDGGIVIAVQNGEVIGSSHYAKPAQTRDQGVPFREARFIRSGEHAGKTLYILSHVFLKEDYRRMGIGLKLLNTIFDYTAPDSRRLVVLGTSIPRFWASLGCESVGRLMFLRARL